MREIHHADDAEHHGVADGDKAVDRAERDAVDQLLQEIAHAGRDSLGREWPRDTYTGLDFGVDSRARRIARITSLASVSARSTGTALPSWRMHSLHAP